MPRAGKSPKIIRKVISDHLPALSENDGLRRHVVRRPPLSRRLIDQAIAKLQLDLSDLVVLTEAATGHFVVTPLVAALAGAAQVLAITADSRYGTAEAAREQTTDLARRWHVERQIEVFTSRTDPRIAQADIVTNLGFVRPLDAPMLARLKPTAVIPLMFETWERRPADLDLDACRRRGLCVLGTNERDERLRIFDYVGEVAVKLATELDVELPDSHVIVVGGGEFGRGTMAAFKKAGAHATQVRPRDGQALGDPAIVGQLPQTDLLVFVEHEDRRMLLGPGGLEINRLTELAPHIAIVHISGAVDADALARSGIPHRPAVLAPPGRMSVTTAYLGPQPVIDLHAAGLKVGEAMARGMRQFGDVGKAVAFALEHSPAMDFQ